MMGLQGKIFTQSTGSRIGVNELNITRPSAGRRFYATDFDNFIWINIDRTWDHNVCFWIATDSKIAPQLWGLGWGLESC